MPKELEGYSKFKHQVFLRRFQLQLCSYHLGCRSFNVSFHKCIDMCYTSAGSVCWQSHISVIFYKVLLWACKEFTESLNNSCIESCCSFSLSLALPTAAELLNCCHFFSLVDAQIKCLLWSVSILTPKQCTHSRLCVEGLWSRFFAGQFSHSIELIITSWEF